MTRWQPSPGVHYLFAVTVAASALALMFPRLDIVLMQPMFLGNTQFLLDGHPFNGTYKSIRRALALCFVLALLGLSAAAAAGRPLQGFTPRKLLALWGTLVLGVVLIGHVMLKAGFDRPRPEDSDVFGGPLPYIPAWNLGGACTNNCSFVSGDVSFVFVGVLFVLWARPGWRRYSVLTAVLALGLFTGAMRMLTGNHFPTDVLFAALTTALTATVLHDALVTQRVLLPALPRRAALAADLLVLYAMLTRIQLERSAARLRRRF